MSNPAFDVLLPATRSSCVVFASPHSSRTYPRSFVVRSVLDEHSIRTSEDAFVDQLFAPAAEFGAPLLTARVPRAYVDLNRSADELDPALVLGARKQGHNPRVASGLGVIPRVVANGRAIYQGKISMEEARMRIDRYWRPYHLALQGLLAEAHQAHGQAILVDCHSMPHEAVECVVRAGTRRPDVVLGDRFGSSASMEIVERIEAILAGAGLVVARNAPFAGAFVTQHYGRPSRRQHAVQIEIDRALYMHEAQILPRPDFDAFRDVITRVVAEITEIGKTEMPLAAE